MIGPRLRAKFPHLSTNQGMQHTAGPEPPSAPSCISHKHTAVDELRCIAGVDPAANQDANASEPLQSVNSSGLGSHHLGPNFREGEDNTSAAVLADAEPLLLAAADSAASAPAAAVIQKKRSKPFRIPKRT